MNHIAPILLSALATSLSASVAVAGERYPIVDTGQTKCYDNRSEIAPPRPGQPFYGQDAQFRGHTASYTPSADGLTVHDNVTGLTWQRSPNTDGDGVLTTQDKLTLTQAQALPVKLNTEKFGGFNDWRLPSIKELYSLFDARGIDPSGPTDADTSSLTPYLDTNYFKFAYGDPGSGERVIDSQWASSTLYVANPNQMFGVNFADGRIKGYGSSRPGRPSKTFFVLCVCGNPSYGKNDFRDNGDGTLTDRATGLMWSKADSGHGMSWEDALAWVQRQNGERFLGHNDWRLPNVKALQSIADYSRAPDTTHSPAIDPVFACTAITNETRQVDYPFYWSSTTHAGLRGGGAAMYVAFGRAAGWMLPGGMAGGPQDRRGGFGRGPEPGFGGPPGEGPPGAGPRGRQPGDYRYVDVHGAGAQRSDPKAGDPGMFPHGRGPQGDVIRIYNYVRLVRTAD
jgi:hypothetical protein